MNTRRLTVEQLDELGRIADRVDNLVHAGTIPMPDSLRLRVLVVALPELRDDLRKLYVDVSGENPWSDEPKGGASG